MEAWWVEGWDLITAWSFLIIVGPLVRVASAGLLCAAEWLMVSAEVPAVWDIAGDLLGAIGIGNFYARR